MKGSAALWRGVLFLGLFATIATNSLGASGFQRVKVRAVIRDPRTSQPVALLADPGGKRAMPIWIGEAEAMALQSAMEGTMSKRPMTHDLLASVIKHLKGSVEEVRVTELKDDIYYALILIKGPQGLIQVDSRPSDAMVLAVKLGKPISVESSLFEARSVPLSGTTMETYGLEVQALDPALKEAMGYKGKGLLVSHVEEGSLAEKAGLRRGDIVAKAQGKALDSPEDLESMFPVPPQGLKLEVRRKGERLEILLPPEP
jgi:bifunctional DNase/RNase